MATCCDRDKLTVTFGYLVRSGFHKRKTLIFFVYLCFFCSFGTDLLKSCRDKQSFHVLYKLDLGLALHEPCIQSPDRPEVGSNQELQNYSDPDFFCSSGTDLLKSHRRKHCFHVLYILDLGLALHKTCFQPPDRPEVGSNLELQSYSDRASPRYYRE